VFASGRGTNLQALLDYEGAHPSWPAQVAAVVSDTPACEAVARARDAGVPVFAARMSGFPDKTPFETEVLHTLKTYKVEWLVLAGYMRLVGPTLLSAFDNRIVNIHPSLLPAFPGRTPVRDALTARVSQTGVTIHYVDAGVDTGPIIAQETVRIEPGMSETDLLETIHRVEHRLYPEVIGRLVSSRMNDATASEYDNRE
jgi:phosphoribosylglycinamide formyltransferase 1